MGFFHGRCSDVVVDNSVGHTNLHEDTMIYYRGMTISASLRERFYARVSPEPNSGCWLWAGGYFVSGYGSFHDRHTAERRRWRAHRLSYVIHFGPIVPDELYVLHRCDTPGCVNPDHLFLGTQQDNIADCYSKGRARERPRGVGALGLNCRKCRRLKVGDNALLQDNSLRCRHCYRAAKARRAARMRPPRLFRR